MGQHMSNMFMSMRTENQTLREEMRRENQSLTDGLAQMWDMITQSITRQNNLTTTLPTSHNQPPNNPQNIQPRNNSQTIQPPTTPPLHTPEQQITTRLHQEKAFKNLLNATSTKFSGKDVLEYAPWKKALTAEKENIQLNATQELQLLETRTEAEPNQLIRDHPILQFGLSPEIALEEAWKTLDKRYKTPHSPSQLLIQKITQGPIIHINDTHALFSLSIHCRSVISMKETDPKAIQSLNNPGTIDLITNRLDNALKDKWFDHQSTLPRGSDAPDFEDLTEWIGKRAEVARNHNNSRPNSPIHT